MIIEAKTKKPFIHFGFNKQEVTINLGDSVTIWQDTLYSNDAELTLNGASKTNNYKNTITPTAVGTMEIEVKILVDKILYTGNKIKIIVE